MSLGLPDRHWNVLQWVHLVFSTRTRTSEKRDEPRWINCPSIVRNRFDNAGYEAFPAHALSISDRAQCRRYITGYPVTGKPGSDVHVQEYPSMYRSIPSCSGVSLHLRVSPHVKEYPSLFRSIAPSPGVSLHVQEYPSMSRSIPPCTGASLHVQE